MPKIICISDTHELEDEICEVPNGDILVHAGDFSLNGSLQAAQKFSQWLHRLPYQHIILIGGNHDACLQKSPERTRRVMQNACPRLLYLEDTDVEVSGLKFYGSPWTPYFSGFHDGAFTEMRGRLKEKWAKIPYGLDVLITHGPPAGNLGGVLPQGEDVGDGELRNAIMEKKPRLHVCGHIHEGRGEKIFEGMKFVNASICAIGRAGYYPRNNPILVDLPKRA